MEEKAASEEGVIAFEEEWRVSGQREILDRSGATLQTMASGKEYAGGKKMNGALPCDAGAARCIERGFRDGGSRVHVTRED